jgi:hypothetical protein
VANDIRKADSAQIEFVEKYAGDLFVPSPDKALRWEREEVKFLNEEIIPFLTKIIDKEASQ